jgi:hypothetical protein
MADVPEQTQQYRVTGPYSRQEKDAEGKTITVEYKQGDVITPTQEQLDAFPDRFELPPEGYVLAPTTPAPAEEAPPDEPTAPRSRR